MQRRLEQVRDGNEKLGLKARPYLANLLYARMKPFFAWCAKPKIGKLKSSPMLGIDKPFGDEKRRERDWFKKEAADETIKQLWSAADKLGGVEGQYPKVLLLTGKRKSALAAMKWEEIEDWKGGWFWDPPKGQKNKRLHAVPLANLAARILHPRQANGFVFPSKRGGKLDVSQALTKRVIAAGAREDFFLHGCRQICETKLAKLGVKAHIRDLLFDHAPNRGSGEGYDHHDYADEMRVAVDQWAAYIERLVSPEGVKRLKG